MEIDRVRGRYEKIELGCIVGGGHNSRRIQPCIVAPLSFDVRSRAGSYHRRNGDGVFFP